MRHALAVLCVMSAEAAAERGGVRPGEGFTFRFAVGPVESGRARMAVGEMSERAGQRLLAVHGQAETSKWLKAMFKLDDDYSLVLDPRTLLPVEIHSVEHGVRERSIDSRVNGQKAQIAVAKPKTPPSKAERVLPGPVRDPLTALFVLRALPLAQGEHFSFDVLDGVALYRLGARVRRGEKVRLESDGESARSRKAVRIDVELVRLLDDGRVQPGVPHRHVRAWLSDDDERVPLRIEGDTDLGVCSLELTSYTPARRSAGATAAVLPGIAKLP